MGAVTLPFFPKQLRQNPVFLEQFYPSQTTDMLSSGIIFMAIPIVFTSKPGSCQDMSSLGLCLSPFLTLGGSLAIQIIFFSVWHIHWQEQISLCSKNWGDILSKHTLFFFWKRAWWCPRNSFISTDSLTEFHYRGLREKSSFLKTAALITLEKGGVSNV